MKTEPDGELGVLKSNEERLEVRRRRQRGRGREEGEERRTKTREGRKQEATEL